MKFHLYADPTNPLQILGQISLTTPAELHELGAAMMDTMDRLNAEEQDGHTVTKAKTKGAFQTTGMLQIYDAFHQTPEGTFCKTHAGNSNPQTIDADEEARLYYGLSADEENGHIEIRITFLDDMIRQSFRNSFRV